MKILAEWGQAVLFAILVWILVAFGMIAATNVHEWHLSEKNTCTVVAATEQEHK